MHCRRESWWQRAGWFAVGAAVLLSGTSAFAQQLRDQVRQAVEDRISAVQGQASAYWIGIACEEVPRALRTQLGLADQQGVLVVDVIADAPAAKAGLKKYDIVLAIDDHAIATPEQLAQAVSKAKDKEIVVRYLRDAKEATATVTPAERPRRSSLEEQLIVPEGDQESFRSWLERFRGPGMEPHPFAMRFFHPGMILPPGASVEVDLPDDMSVTISKRAKEPAKIHVEQGDKSWDVTEDKLQQLPDDVRVHVERMLGRATFDAAVAAPEGDAAKTRPGRPQSMRPARPSDLDSRTAEQLDHINDQLRQLQKAVEELKSGNKQR